MKAFIEKILVEGFKSYGKERKEIPLGEGFISIVGPNGAGKSNIGDAISFALGIATTKTLRAKNLSYLIFSKDGDSSDSAYVEVHFRNNGAFPLAEERVVISRKVTRDGRSTFRINGTTVREKDLKDFLSKAGIYENGYNVVLQGDIVKFLRMTPVERRKVIEDVAGISEYEAKKQKAIGDLAEVDIKIRELKLLLEEIKIQLEKLREEKERLERYRKLLSERRETEIAILSKEIRKLKAEEEKVSSELSTLRNNLSRVKEQIREKEQILSEREERLKELTDQLLPFRERIGRVSADIEHLSREIESGERRKKELVEEREKEEKALAYLEKDLENLRSERRELLEELDLREKELEELRVQEREAYAELKRLDEELKVSLETAQRVEEKEKQLKEHIESMKEEEQNILIKLKEIDIKIEKTREDIGRLKDERQQLEQRIRESAEELEKLRRMRTVEQDTLKRERAYLKETEEELKEVRRKIEEVIKAKGYVESRLSSAEAVGILFEGIEGVYGTVGDLITVPDPEHIKAVEAAGGARLKYVVYRLPEGEESGENELYSPEQDQSRIPPSTLSQSPRSG